MKKTKLIIIGNGFDRHFGLPTSYEDFEKHITEKYPKEKEDMEDVFLLPDADIKTLWSNFEENLERINKDLLLSNELKTPDEAEEIYSNIVSCKNTIKGFFEEWAKTLPCEVKVRNKTLVEDAFIISFNYTFTLEKNFNVGQNQVYHIHGTTKEDIVFGHKQGVSFPRDPVAPYDRDPEELENYNPNKKAIIDWLNQYLKETEKPIDDIIQKSEKLLVDQYQFKFEDVEEIVVIGHSYSEIDLPYFEWINCKTNSKWKLGYYKNFCNAYRFSKNINTKTIAFRPNKKLIGEILV